jgi:hypothetical protein
METKTFSTNSFIYRFLAWPSAVLPRRSHPDDICDLRQAVIIKAVLCLLGISVVFDYFFSLAAFGLFVLSHYFSGFSAYAVDNFVVRMGSAYFVLTVGAAAIVASLYATYCFQAWFSNYIHNRRYKREEAGLKPLLHPVTSPVKEMYKSWKDKLCYRVSFE